MDIREELKDEVSENTLKKRRKYYLKHGVKNLFPAGFLEDLTKEQESYFKDSKVRDKKGDLLVCYHGTINPGFKEFNASKGKSQFGEYKFRKYNVNYFTTSKETARGYTKLGTGDVYACYLNVVNPYIVNNETEEDIKSWRNIKDTNIRNKEIKAFDRIFNKWCDNFPIIDDLDEINKDFYPFGYEFRLKNKDDELIDVYKLPDNSYFGNEEKVLSSYYLFELFDKDDTTLKDTIIGEEEDDYYLNNDDIVKWVLYMNENEGTNYDGIIIPDILDVGPSGSPFSENTTDIITLKSSNQIKLITNKNPTSSSRIDEDKQSLSSVDKTLSSSKLIKSIYNSTVSSVLKESVEKDKEWYKVKETGEIGFKVNAFSNYVILFLSSISRSYLFHISEIDKIDIKDINDSKDPAIDNSHLQKLPADVKVEKVSEFLKDCKRLKLSNKLKEIEDKVKNNVPNTNIGYGIHKVRISIDSENRGQSGSYRISYYYKPGRDCYLLTMFAKNEKENLTDEEEKELKNIVDSYIEKN